VEEILASVSIENHFAVARSFNNDWFVGRTALGQIVRAVERRSQGGNRPIEPSISEAAVFIDAGMNKNDVAGLNTRRQGVGMIGLIRTHVVGRKQSGKRRFLPGSLISEGINVIDAAASGRLRFLPGACNH